MSDIPKMMRALVYRGVNDLRVEKVPVPKIGGGELLVKVAVCGVCPTDIKKIQYGTVSPPRIFGHETAGTIVRVGARVRRFAVGDRVALHHHVPCMKCHMCRHRAFAQCEAYKRTGVTAGFEAAGGGYAEYVRVMEFVLPGVVKIPARNTFEEGAMLEPVNTVLKGVNRLALLAGDWVMVVGQGPIGLIFTRLLTLRGVNVLATELLESRLQFAKVFGAKWAVHGERADLRRKIIQITRGRGLDAVVVTVPSDEIVRESQGFVRGGGQILLFAHTRHGALSQVDLSQICITERDLIGSYSADFTLQSQAARLVFSRALDLRQLITDRFPLEQGEHGISWAAAPREGVLKVVVFPVAAQSQSCAETGENASSPTEKEVFSPLSSGGLAVSRNDSRG